ncbi:MAG: hypothetical protein WAO23_04630 [Dethiobacteria bacterium]
MYHIRHRVEKCIEELKHSSEELRLIADDTENEQARNAFNQTSIMADECIQKCQIALNQLK